jgi:hypothetical protein
MKHSAGLCAGYPPGSSDPPPGLRGAPVWDEVAGLVIINGAGITALLTIAVLGGQSVPAVLGITVLCVVATAALASMAKAQHRGASWHHPVRLADVQSNSTDTVVSTIVDDHASPRWLTDAARARLASSHRSVGVGPSIEVSQPSIVVGNGFTEHVDHGLMTRLAAPRAD